MVRTLAVSGLALVLAACSGSGGKFDGGPDPSGSDGGMDAGMDAGTLTCLPGTSTLRVGQTEQLTVLGVDGGVRWSSVSPGVADVDMNGVVTASSIGTTDVVVETDTDHGVCAVTVISLCQNIAQVTGWTGSLSIDYSNSAVVGSTSYMFGHHVTGDFALTKDPLSTDSNPRWITQTTTGSGSMSESEVISGGANVSQTGSGTPITVGDLSFSVDPSACTYTFDWLWALDTTYTVDGSSMPVSNVNLGEVTSVPIAFTPGWSSGLTYSNNFVGVGMLGAGQMVNKYVLLTQIANAYFTSTPGPSGNAQIEFSATPQ
jgi:hypothetical protein